MRSLISCALLFVCVLSGGRAMANESHVSLDRKIACWLASGEFNSDADLALTNIVRGAERSRTEAETAAVWEREIYYLVRSRLGIDVGFKKETPVSGIVHDFSVLAKRRSGRGRLDAVVNDLVIEYKHHSRLADDVQRREAIAQVCDYLVAMRKGDGICRSAILTDGMSVAYFSFSGDEVRHTQLRMIGVEDIETVIRAILANGAKKFDPENISRDFSVSAQAPSESRRLAAAFFDALTARPTPKTEMLYEEWKGLMHLSVEDCGKSADIEKRRRDLSAIFDTDVGDAEREYKALFALQTAYSVIVKLIACRVVDELNYNDDARSFCDLLELTSPKLQNFLQMMEDGYSYSNMGVRNFLEGDFFSWYADETQWGWDFFAAISKIVAAVDEYSAFSLNVRYEPVDVFKDLYMGIIPQSVRHSMGEYFTPEWLADGVVTRSLELLPSKEKDGWKAVDPCCGSGIFLMSLIRHVVGDVVVADLSRQERQRLVDEVLSRVYGIDINPLSVLSARVSYYLALHRLGSVANVEIPVYLGDSAVIPKSRLVDGIDCYAYSVNNMKCRSFDVVLPKRFVRRDDFGKVMSRLQALVKAENADALCRVFFERLDEEERGSAKLTRSIRDLAESLVELHRRKWDGIWIRIAMNFMLIARMESFDLIVGNPPWVKWEHLPEAYTQKVKSFCDVRHIFCNDGGVFGGAQLNICALIANVTASNWLKEDGILSFLMPDSIMSQNSYEEFRNFYLAGDKERRLYLQAIDRWLPPLRPFRVGGKVVSQDFNTYYYGSRLVDYAKGVPVRELTRTSRTADEAINACADFPSAKRLLVESEGVARQLSRQSTAFTYDSSSHDFGLIVGPSDYLYRTGVESTPFEVFKMISAGPSSDAGHHRFRNKVLKTSRYKVDDIPAQGWNFTTTHLYPMLEGPSVKPFSFDCGENYHVVPYDPHDTSKPVSFETLAANDPELADYFASHRRLLNMQSDKSKMMHRGGAFYALSKIGPYTFAPHMVAARDNTYFCATVVRDTKTAWGEVKKTICVKHTIIISQDRSGRFITEDEAHYANGILNSSIVHDYIHSTFKANGFSLNKSKLFLPRYREGERLFEAIAELSKRATAEEGFRREAPDALTKAYVALCRRFNK